MGSSMKRKLLAGAGGLACLVALWIASSQMCLSAWLFSDVVVDQCPDGKLRQTLSMEGASLVRGTPGEIRVRAFAHYSTGLATEVQQTPVRKLDAELFLVNPSGKEEPLPPKKGWTSEKDHAVAAMITLPQVPDGDYRLRAKVKTKLGADTVDAPLPLYAPARVHVITDRPLYEPGNTVRFRAVVLRAKDLAPLDGRPGLWEVRSPSGDVLLEEKAPAGDWGVVAGSFPLDRGAESGNWTVAWRSGPATDAVQFKVEPFTLPRFHVDVEPARPFYRPGDRPVLKGAVAYSSGAPVANAGLTLSWNVSGEWPAPPSWRDGGLPQKATTGADGRFTLELPQVPADLRKQVTLAAQISAVDRAGDRVEGSASLLLTEDAIAVSAVTELGEGLVEGFNNRVYLRATTADGRALPGAKLRLRRAWDPRDVGVETVADEDGVASLQLDPGPAVNIVIPPMPVRPPPKERAVSRGEADELLTGEEASLADQTELDRWLAALEPCARFVSAGTPVRASEESEDGTDEEPQEEEEASSSELVIGLRVSSAGAITATASNGSPLAACALDVIRARRFPASAERLYSLRLAFTDRDIPQLIPELTGVPEVPAPVAAAIQRSVLGARSCLADNVESTSLPRALQWHTTRGSKDVAVSWVLDPQRRAGSHPAQGCIEAKLAHLTLGKPARSEGLGLARLRIQASPRMEEIKPQATTMLGYELLVAAAQDGKEVGTTKLRMAPGVVPPVRLRATPVLGKAGEPVDVELLRGPGFDGQLPEKLVMELGEKKLEAKVDPQKRSARFELPKDAEGWLQVQWAGARALVYVRPKAELSVSIEPERPQYAPGQLARLLLHTTVGGADGKAAVGLFGVDESLSQLAPLPAPDNMARVRPQVAVSSPAFGVLDGQALAMGRVRGANAAAATVLRVSSIPTAEIQDAPAVATAASSFDPNEDLADHFYTVLSELHAEARTWEEKAPPGEQMNPKLLASLWQKALDACERKKLPNTDAYGRRLRLSQLPEDLLALTDPRQVVVTKTRLPEDVESWNAWVAKEQP